MKFPSPEAIYQMMHLEEMYQYNMEQIFGLVLTMFDDNREISPCLVVIANKEHQEEKSELIELGPLILHDQTVVRALIDAYIADPDYDAVVFISEAWVTNMQHAFGEAGMEDIKKRMHEGTLTPSEVKALTKNSKEEAIMMVMESLFGRLFAQAPIYRDGFTPPYLGQLEFMPMKAEAKGVITGY